MFQPQYVISHQLLANIKKINLLIAELNQRKFPRVIIYQFEKLAREVSTFASTSIEGNPLPLTEVKQVLKSQPHQLRKTEQEVLNYNQALKWLNQKLKKGQVVFDLKLVLEVHRLVVDHLAPNYQRGKLRKEPVFVNDPRMGKTVYWPPDVKDVFKLTQSLIQFVKDQQTKIDPLILAGIFHRQLVIIHPFMDGNGRTVRLLTKVLLARMGLNTFHLFSFENYYNQNVSQYFKTVGLWGNYYDLTAKIDFTAWLEYFTEGIINELLRVKNNLFKSVLTPAEELNPYHRKILAFIQKKGYIQDKDYVQLTSRAKATRSLDFKHLLKLGLIQKKAKGRATFYVLK